MVILAENAHPPTNTTARAEAHPPRHNFPLPVIPNWGAKRILRCVKVNRHNEPIGSPPPPPLVSRSVGDGDELLEQVRETLPGELREAEDRVVTPEAEAVAFSPQWNLRTRRAPMKDRSTLPPPAMGSCEDTEMREQTTITITLTKEEIDEDFIAITGAKPRRRQKRRPRNVQKQLDMLFPGSTLSNITADLYKVDG